MTNQSNEKSSLLCSDFSIDSILVDRQLDKQFILDYPFPYFVDEVRLSHSTMATFLDCPRKFEFSKLFQNPQRRDSLAAQLGTALHEGFQDWLINHDFNRAIFKMMLAYPWEYGESPMKDRSAEGAYATLVEMINQFDADRYELAYINSLDGTPVPCVEVPFQIVFKNFELETFSPDGRLSKPIRLTYVGYMDLVLFDKQEDEFLVVDIKSTSDRSEDLTPKYKFSDQCVPYGLVLNQLLNIPINDLKVGYLTAKVNLAAPLVRNYYFYKSAQDLSDWARGIKERLEQLQRFTANAWFPRTPNGCTAFGSTCPYFDMCQDRDAKRTQIQLAYDGEHELPKPFDPLISVELDLDDLII